MAKTVPLPPACDRWPYCMWVAVVGRRPSSVHGDQTGAEVGFLLRQLYPRASSGVGRGSRQPGFWTCVLHRWLLKNLLSGAPGVSVGEASAFGSDPELWGPGFEPHIGLPAQRGACSSPASAAPLLVCLRSLSVCQINNYSF